MSLSLSIAYAFGFPRQLPPMRVPVYTTPPLPHFIVLKQNEHTRLACLVMVVMSHSSLNPSSQTTMFVTCCKLINPH